ncbi:MAG: zinc ribbon domain-containing protein [Candidatus Brocadiia bacterium]
MARQKVPVKFCRHCGRMIPQDSVDCPYCGKNTIPKVTQKECPFCGELVRAKAVKCKHCGEFLDGRRTERGGAIYIEKAIITGGGEGPAELIPEAPPEETEARTGPERQVPAPDRKKLPAGEEAQPPATVSPAPVPTRKEARRVSPAEETEQAEPPEGPPAQYECPSCGRFVYEGDNFCENCGRDLSIPSDRREKLGPPKRYETSDYALMVGAAAPVGLLIGPPVALAIAGAGALLSGWCLWRILSPDTHLCGAAPAAGGLAASGFWGLMILLFA